MMMTAKQAAKALGLSVERVRQLCQAGVMGRKVGRDWLITPDEVARYRENRRRPGRPRKADD